MGLRKYVKDYDNVVKIDNRGREVFEPVYKGQYYRVNFNDQELKVLKRTLLLISVGVLAVLIAAGFIQTGGTYYIYVGAPYALSFFPVMYLIIAALRLPLEKRQYRRDEAELTFGRVKTSTMILLVLLIATSLGQIVFLLINQTQLVRSDFAFLSLLLMAAVVAIILVKQGRKPIIELEEIPEKPE